MLQALPLAGTRRSPQSKLCHWLEPVAAHKERAPIGQSKTARSTKDLSLFNVYQVLLTIMNEYPRGFGLSITCQV